MPRKDRSFTPKDVIRIIDNNLTNNEKKAVIQELCRNQEEEEALVEVFTTKDIIEGVKLAIDLVTGGGAIDLLLFGIGGLLEGQKISGLLDFEDKEQLLGDVKEALSKK